jgi:ribosomal protein S11
MRRALLLVVVLAAALALFLLTAPAGELSIRDYRGKLVAGEWAWDFPYGEVPVADAHEFTGFAYGPGRAEIAYCASDEPNGPSKLRVITTQVEEEYGRQRPALPTTPPRLLWTAPEGVTLRGPIWWAPNGSKIALRACSEDSSDLIVVDYATGSHIAITEGCRVVDAAWRPGASQLAYVAEDDSARTVSLAAIPPAEAHRLGRGGFDLRWTVDGRELHWLSPHSETTWTRMRWSADDAGVSEIGSAPARPEQTIWSPDGRWCAALEPAGDGKRSLAIYPVSSHTGDTADLPGVEPVELLGFSPDSTLALVLDRGGEPVAVSVRPIPTEIRRVLPSRRSSYCPARGTVASFPMQPDAGPPSWCTTGHHLLAYVAAEQPRPSRGMHAPELAGKLVVRAYEREYLGAAAEAAAKVERQQLDYNLKNIALVFQMYLADNNDIFPATSEMPDLRRILDPYVYTQEVFLRPGSKDEVCVRYLVEAGLKLVEVRDPCTFPIAIIDYPEDYYIVGYADGHVQTFEGEPPPELQAPEEP